MAFPQRGSSRIKRRAPEQAFHCAVARYLTFALPPQFFWSTIPSGGGGLIRGANLKRAGLKPGLPDLVIFKPSVFAIAEQGPFTLWLELKAKSGSLSSEQRQVHKALEALGHRVEVAKSIERVERVVAEFIHPNLLRARPT